jgi:glycosyltransferase involved in cell wall biosynthesis
MTVAALNVRAGSRSGVTVLSVTEQELIAHVFVPLDGPSANPAEAWIRRLWSGLRNQLGATEPIATTGLPAVIPATLPVASALIAAQQSPDRAVQAVLRREDEILNLSVLLAAESGSTWVDRDRQLDGVFGRTIESAIGLARLYLGKVTEGPDLPAAGELTALLPPSAQDGQVWHRPYRTVAGLTLWEGSVGEGRAVQQFVVLARPDQDDELGDWTWAPGLHPNMPRFARYLMHMAKIRYQYRVWSRLAPAAERYGKLERLIAQYRGSQGDDVALGARFGATQAELAELITQLRTMRLTVSTSARNAAAALVPDDPDTGHDLMRSDDEEFAAWFGQNLTADIDHLETFYDGMDRLRAVKPIVEPSGERELVASAPIRAPAGSSSARRLLVVADEWLPRPGGPATLNRYLARALVARGAEVFCLVPASSEAAREDAQAAGVQLIDAAESPGTPTRQALMRRPALPGDVEPDAVIGYGRVTGAAAQAQAEDNFENSICLHVVHQLPDQPEWHLIDGEDDTATPVGVRSDQELTLARAADVTLSLGPVITDWLDRDLPEGPDGPGPTMLVPGFDGAGDGARKPPNGRPQILMLGRMAELPGAAMDLAARAIGQAWDLSLSGRPWDLLIHGTPANEVDRLTAAMSQRIRTAAVRVTVPQIPPDFRRFTHDLARSSLVLLSGPAEGFGILAMDAIMAGIPVLVSDTCGLGVLLHQSLPRDSYLRVTAPTGGSRADVDRWAHLIAAALTDRPAAFTHAAGMRSALASAQTWDMAAAQVLEIIEARLTAAS